MLKVSCYDVLTIFVGGKLKFYRMRREFQLNVDSKWHNVRNLFADKNFNFIPWLWLQSQWQWGWGESWVSSLYLPPNYSHNNVHQAALFQQIHVQCLYMNEAGALFFQSLVPRNASWWVVIIKLTFGKHAPKGNQSTKFTIAEQSRKWAILRRFYWAVNEASGPEIKYQPSFYYRGSQHVMGQESGLGCQEDVRMTCH